jgi:hypothetical protein
MTEPNEPERDDEGEGQLEPLPDEEIQRGVEQDQRRAEEA